MGTSDQDTSAQHTLQSNMPQAQSVSSTGQPGHRSRRRRWGRAIGLALSIILLLALIGGGGAGYFAYHQYPALDALSNRFCVDLSQQNYTDAYGLLSPQLQAQFSKPTFLHMGQDLDSIQGPVKSCSVQSQDIPQIGTFPLSLTIPAALSRAATHRGTIRAVYAGGTWKLDGISVPLLGISPSALGIAEQYCQDASTGAFLGLWSLYGQALQRADPENQVKASAATLPHLKSLGPSSFEGCVTSLGALNSDTAAHVTIGQVSANLGREHGSWKITSISSDLVDLLINANAPATPQDLSRQLAFISKEVAQIQQGSSAPDWYAFDHNAIHVYIATPDYFSGTRPLLTPGGVIAVNNGYSRVIAAGFVGAFTDTSNHLYAVLLVQDPSMRSTVPGSFLNAPRFLIVQWLKLPASFGLGTFFGPKFTVIHVAPDVLGEGGGAGDVACCAIELLSPQQNPLVSALRDYNAAPVAQAADDSLTGQWIGIPMFPPQLKTYLGSVNVTNNALADYLSGASGASPQPLLSAQEVLPVIHAIMSGNASAAASIKLSEYSFNYSLTNYKAKP